MTRRSQKPITGGRERLSPTVLKEISREVDRQARRFNVSRSFVIAVALAEVFWIEEQEQYIVATTTRWKRPITLVRARS